MSNRNICVLRSGGDFTPEHVQRLAGMVPDLWCLSDYEIDGIKTIRLQHDWQGFWAKMELFRPDIEGDLFYFDLDTTVYNLPPAPDQTTVLRDFRKGHLIGSGLMFLKEAERSRVWNGFIDNPAKAIKANRSGLRWGDQGFLMDYYRESQRWQDIAKVYSYKYHCLEGVPSDADIVCFHGNPRPWDVGH